MDIDDSICLRYTERWGNMRRIDLHMHSTFSSDGDYSPANLVESCAGAGVSTIALTDHNSTRGVLEIKTLAGQYAIEVIPAIELDCQHKGINLHLLGYWIDPGHPVFQKIESAVLAMEQLASQELIRKISALGIELDLEELDQLAFHGVTTGEMIAEVALRQSSNRSHPLLQPYYRDGARSDNPFVNFYWDLCSQGKPAYVPMYFMSLDDAVAAVAQAGGVPVLAHPGINIGQDEPKLADIIKAGVKGIETFSSYHDPATTGFFRQMAEKYNLAMTCGSDFHGKTKPNIKIGSVACDQLETAILQRLQELAAVSSHSA